MQSGIGLFDIVEMQWPLRRVSPAQSPARQDEVQQRHSAVHQRGMHGINMSGMELAGMFSNFPGCSRWEQEKAVRLGVPKWNRHLQEHQRICLQGWIASWGNQLAARVSMWQFPGDFDFPLKIIMRNRFNFFCGVLHYNQKIRNIMVKKKNCETIKLENSTECLR